MTYEVYNAQGDLLFTTTSAKILWDEAGKQMWITVGKSQNGNTISINVI